MFVNETRRTEFSLQRTFHICFLPSFGLFGEVSFRGEDFQKSTNQKQEFSVAAMFVNKSGRNEQTLQRTFHRCFLPNFSSFGKAVSEETIFQKSTNQKQELPVAAMLVNRSELNEQSLQRGPSIDTFYQVSDHLAKGFQRRRLKCEKSTDDRRQVIAKAHIALGKVSYKIGFTYFNKCVQRNLNVSKLHLGKLCTFSLKIFCRSAFDAFTIKKKQKSIINK